jgi:hypothetical protein
VQFASESRHKDPDDFVANEFVDDRVMIDENDFAAVSKKHSIRPLKAAGRIPSASGVEPRTSANRRLHSISAPP